MSKYFEKGFIDKCAEYGVDPQHLIKLAVGFTESVGTGGMLNPINMVGYAAGRLMPARSAAQQAGSDMSRKTTLGNLFLPGMAGYQSGRRAGFATKGPELAFARQSLNVARQNPQGAAGNYMNPSGMSYSFENTKRPGSVEV